MSKSDPVVGFRIPEELARRFKAAAALEGRAMQDIVADAIREFLAKHEGAAAAGAPIEAQADPLAEAMALTLQSGEPIQTGARTPPAREITQEEIDERVARAGSLASPITPMQGGKKKAN